MSKSSPAEKYLKATLSKEDTQRIRDLREAQGKKRSGNISIDEAVEYNRKKQLFNKLKKQYSKIKSSPENLIKQNSKLDDELAQLLEPSQKQESKQSEIEAKKLINFQKGKQIENKRLKKLFDELKSKRDLPLTAEELQNSEAANKLFSDIENKQERKQPVGLFEKSYIDEQYKQNLRSRAKEYAKQFKENKADEFRKKKLFSDWKKNAKKLKDFKEGKINLSDEELLNIQKGQEFLKKLELSEQAGKFKKEIEDTKQFIEENPVFRNPENSKREKDYNILLQGLLGDTPARLGEIDNEKLQYDLRNGEMTPNLRSQIKYAEEAKSDFLENSGLTRAEILNRKAEAELNLLRARAEEDERLKRRFREEEKYPEPKQFKEIKQPRQFKDMREFMKFAQKNKDFKIGFDDALKEVAKISSRTGDVSEVGEALIFLRLGDTIKNLNGEYLGLSEAQRKHIENLLNSEYERRFDENIRRDASNMFRPEFISAQGILTEPNTIYEESGSVSNPNRFRINRAYGEDVSTFYPEAGLYGDEGLAQLRGKYNIEVPEHILKKLKNRNK